MSMPRTLDSTLRDRLIYTRLHREAIQAQFLVEQNLTLAKALDFAKDLDLAKGMEPADKNTKLLHTTKISLVLLQ